MAVAMPLRTYRIVLEPEPDGSAWNVTVPSLPGCFTFGATQAEAIERAEEAIRCHIKGLLADREPVPPPDSDFSMVTVWAPA